MKCKYIVSLFILGIFLLYTPFTFSQCKITNNYFQSGETLQYDLHFKWGLVSKKSGKATMRTASTNYGGKNAYKITLSSNSEGAARKVFKMDDTISCVLSTDLVPLAFSKDAHEDDDYTKERITYSYPGGNAVRIKTTRHKNGNFKFDETINANRCTYDMLSVVFYARTLDYNTMKKGDRVSVDFMSGKKKLNMVIINNGKEVLKVNDGLKYNCIKLSLKITDDAFENEENAMTVYITNDDNRLPIRIDSKLKVGTARVILRSYKGNKHPVNVAK